MPFRIMVSYIRFLLLAAGDMDMALLPFVNKELSADTHTHTLAQSLARSELQPRGRAIHRTQYEKKTEPDSGVFFTSMYNAVLHKGTQGQFAS